MQVTLMSLESIRAPAGRRQRDLYRCTPPLQRVLV